MPLVPNN